MPDYASGVQGEEDNALKICLSGSAEDHPRKCCELQRRNGDGAPGRARVPQLRPDIAVEQLD